MKIVSLIIACSAAFSCCSQNTNDRGKNYDISNYYLYDSTTIDKSGFFLKLYKNKADENLKMEEDYIDSSRKFIVIRSFLKDNLKNGPIFYFDNLWPLRPNKIAGSGTYVNDKREGEWVHYFSKSGKIEEIKYYKNDLATGTWKYFDESGKLLKTEEWKDGHVQE